MPTSRCSPTREILFHGQALFAVVAETRDEARRAAKLATIEIDEEEPAVTIADALKSGERVQPDYAFGRGDAGAAIAAAPFGSRASSRSAARSISISKARFPSPFPARATK